MQDRASSDTGRVLGVTTRNHASLIVASAGWAMGTVLAKFALSGFGPVTTLVIELAAANVVVWAVALRRGYRRPNGFGRLALLGLLEPAVAYAARTVGLGMTSASNASLLSGTESVFGVLLAAVFLREGITRRGVAGLVVAVTGVVALGGGPSLGAFGPGDALVLLEALTAAVYSVLAARMVAAEDPDTVTAHQFGFGLAFTLPAAVVQWSTGAETLDVPAQYWVAAIVSGAVGFGASFLLYNRAIVHVSVSSAAMILNLIPIFGVAAAVAFLGESLTVPLLVGAALVLGGIALFPHHDLRDGNLACRLCNGCAARCPEGLLAATVGTHGRSHTLSHSRVPVD
ncbi:DMT family transporter [Nonomuraea sp. NPDC050556]|uniref:DMT family transporter n=1 Tax=Nonomuraea sp. NPDC050556 TaxID=3364369 RepID=UPI0037ABEBFC